LLWEEVRNETLVFYMFGVYFVRIKVLLSAWGMSIYVPTICVCMHCCWLGFLCCGICLCDGKELSVCWLLSIVAFTRLCWTPLVQRCRLLTKVRKRSRLRPMARLFWLLTEDKKHRRRYCLSTLMDWQRFVNAFSLLTMILRDWLAFYVHIF